MLAAAEAYGRFIDPSFVPLMMETTDRMASYKPSMKLDYERGLPLEMDTIYRNPLRAAKEAGVECPLIRELYEALRHLDQARDGRVSGRVGHRRS